MHAAVNIYKDKTIELNVLTINNLTSVTIWQILMTHKSQAASWKARKQVTEEAVREGEVTAATGIK